MTPTRSRRLAVCLFALAAIIGSQAPGRTQPTTAAPKDAVVKVKLVDGDGKPLNGATIVAYDGKGRLKKRDVKEDTDGMYTVTIPKETFKDDPKLAFSLHFEHPSWHTQEMPLLSNQNNEQAINRILPNPKGPRDYFDILEQINVYQFLYSVAVAVGPEEVKALRENKGLFEKVKGIPNPARGPLEAPPTVKKDEVVVVNGVPRYKIQVEAINELKKHPEQEKFVQQRLDYLYSLYFPPTQVVIYNSVIVCQPVRRCGIGLFRR